MLKLAEKEKDNIEVLSSVLRLTTWVILQFTTNGVICLQSAKNEAETYMLKELSLLKWQEKATKLASDDATSRVEQLHKNVENLEADLVSKR